MNETKQISDFQGFVNVVKLGRWHSADKHPKKAGWYLRDYRNPPKRTANENELPQFSVDYFRGGFWYIADVRNKAITLDDAWFESLPWCKIKDQ